MNGGTIWTESQKKDSNMKFLSEEQIISYWNAIDMHVKMVSNLPNITHCDATIWDFSVKIK